MTDFEVHLSVRGGTRLVGHARSNRARGKETVHFEYADGWLQDAARFALEPGLPLTRGGFHPPAGRAIHGSLGDSAPDTWGRRLMQRAERILRDESDRVPFLSAMAMMGAKDGEGGSYPEMVDALSSCGAHAKRDAHELYRRVAFNVLVSNVDDHLRNHGFLWRGKSGWVLSPAYDINPVPVDLKARVLTTNIDLDEATCSIGLLESAAGYFALSLVDARSILGQVAGATSRWREVARDVGASSAEMDRMASAFEHDDLRQALAFS